MVRMVKELLVISFAVLFSCTLFYGVSYAQTVHIEISHTFPGDLVIEIGVGSPFSPYWSRIVWNRMYASSDILELSIDVSDADAFLPPYGSNKWYIKVSDELELYTGYISNFRIEYFGNTYTSFDPPVDIEDHKTCYAFIIGSDIFAAFYGIMDSIIKICSDLSVPPMTKINLIDPLIEILKMEEQIDLKSDACLALYGICGDRLISHELKEDIARQVFLLIWGINLDYPVDFTGMATSSDSDLLEYYAASVIKNVCNDPLVSPSFKRIILSLFADFIRNTDPSYLSYVGSYVGGLDVLLLLYNDFDILNNKPESAQSIKELEDLLDHFLNHAFDTYYTDIIKYPYLSEHLYYQISHPYINPKYRNPDALLISDNPADYDIMRLSILAGISYKNGVPVDLRGYDNLVNHFVNLIAIPEDSDIMPGYDKESQYSKLTIYTFLILENSLSHNLISQPALFSLIDRAVQNIISPTEKIDKYLEISDVSYSLLAEAGKAYPSLKQQIADEIGLTQNPGIKRIWDEFSIIVANDTITPYTANELKKIYNNLSLLPQYLLNELNLIILKPWSEGDIILGLSKAGTSTIFLLDYTYYSVDVKRIHVFDSILHEMGHLIDSKLPIDKWIEFQRIYEDSGLDSINFVDNYAKTNRIEDFAVTFDKYVTYPNSTRDLYENIIPESLVKDKLNFIAQNIFVHERDGEEMTYVFENYSSYDKVIEVYLNPDGSPRFQSYYEGWQVTYIPPRQSAPPRALSRPAFPSWSIALNNQLFNDFYWISRFQSSPMKQFYSLNSYGFNPIITNSTNHFSLSTNFTFQLPAAGFNTGQFQPLVFNTQSFNVLGNNTLNYINKNPSLLITPLVGLIGSTGNGLFYNYNNNFL